jgi:hypothetical protein
MHENQIYDFRAHPLQLSLGHVVAEVRRKQRNQRYCHKHPPG